MTTTVAERPDTTKGAALRAFATQLWADLLQHRDARRGRTLDGLKVEWPTRWIEYAAGVVTEADGTAVCRLELTHTGERTAKVALREPGSSGSRMVYLATRGADGGWAWNPVGLAKRLLEQRDMARGRRAGDAMAAQAKAAREAWLNAASARLTPMLDAKDRVAVSCDNLIVTLNATDDPNPHEWPAGDRLDLTLMWDEQGKPVALGMQTSRTAAPHSTSTFDLWTLGRALRYVALVRTWMEEA